MMLLQFNFKNFKSFRDDTTLDLTATKISEYGNHVVTVGNEKVLPVAAIFGANASGKSNVQEAFRYMTTYVVDSFGFGGERAGETGKSEFLRPSPFLLDPESKDAESSFEVYFISSEETGTKSYNYGFSIGQNGLNEEWLNYRYKSARGDYKRIFYRKGKDLDLSGIDSRIRENLKIALEKETLIVSLGAKLKISKLKLIRDWFLDNEIADFGRPAENYFLSEILPQNFVENKNVQLNVVDYFSKFDPSIVGFETETIGTAEDKPSNAYSVFLEP